MARLARAEVSAPDEVAVVHGINRVVRRCILLGEDPVSGKNFDRRKVWIEGRLRQLAAAFGIDLLGPSVACATIFICRHIVLRPARCPWPIAGRSPDYSQPEASARIAPEIPHLRFGLGCARCFGQDARNTGSGSWLRQNLSVS
jgi:hypothetical protein